MKRLRILLMTGLLLNLLITSTMAVKNKTDKEFNLTGTR